jgi:hypothetical protein
MNAYDVDDDEDDKDDEYDDDNDGADAYSNNYGRTNSEQISQSIYADVRRPVYIAASRH